MQEYRSSTIHDARYISSIETLVEARKESGLSQTELADKVGLTQPDISKIERLERRIDITEFWDILMAISRGDRALFEQLWKKIDGHHRRPKQS